MEVERFEVAERFRRQPPSPLYAEGERLLALARAIWIEVPLSTWS